jgi:hypothetical protein
VRIWTAEACKSTPGAPLHVWRVFDEGRQLAWGIVAGDEAAAKAEAARAIDAIEVERQAVAMQTELRPFATNPELLAVWQELCNE